MPVAPGCKKQVEIGGRLLERCHIRIIGPGKVVRNFFPADTGWIFKIMCYPNIPITCNHGVSILFVNNEGGNPGPAFIDATDAFSTNTTLKIIEQQLVNSPIIEG